MLQFLFPGEEAVQYPLLQDVDKLLQDYAAAASKKRLDGEEANKLWSKFEIWSIGLRSSLYELYASYDAAKRYRELITSSFFSDMSDEEKLNYARYIYYDKNGFIRVFSLLDKLGTFMNELLAVRTEKVKPHFSYFTVLRTMREKGLHKELMMPLNELKESCKESTHRLRTRRNTEIHYMNSEMHDDLLQQTRMYGHELRLEDLDQQIVDLEVGLHMAAQSILLTLRYAQKLMPQQ